MATTQRAALAAAKESQTKEVRTCCNCWHIKCGTVILGLIELVAVALILSGIFTQISRSRKFNCDHEFIFKLFRDCESSKFDWTLAGDYFIALLLFTVAICVLLLFLGILIKSPFLLLPHLLIQGVFLISSLAYFFFYARSYFYVDLYKRREAFDIMALLERMWLATLLIILAAFQFYIFFTVIKCCLHLQEYQNERLRRIRQFEECSKRVRDAKQNGLWHYTSWGGSFQQYVGQHDSDSRKLKKRDKPPGHVQWNLQTNIELDEPKNTLNSDETSQQLKVGVNEEDKVRNVIRGVNEGLSEPNLYHGDNEAGITTSLPLPPLNTERVNKQFPKVVPVQPVKPIITTVAATVKPTTAATITALTKKSDSSGDTVPALFHPIERQQRNVEKKPSAGSMTSYRNSVRKISLSSTTFAP